MSTGRPTARQASAVGDDPVYLLYANYIRNISKRRAAMRAKHDSYWKDHSEFAEALDLAYDGSIEPLAAYVEAERLTSVGCTKLTEFLRSFEKQPRGHPTGPVPGDFNEAKRAAVSLVRVAQRIWCANNGRRRVPASVTATMIADAADIASQGFDLPADNKITAADIRQQLFKK